MNRQMFLDVAESSDAETFERRLVAFANTVGFPLFSAGLVVERPGASTVYLGIGNVPDGYASTFHSSAQGRRDPVLSRVNTMPYPVVYDQSLYADDGAGDLWEIQAAFGYKTGIAMAMHMPLGRHFLFGMDRPDPLPDDELEVVRLMGEVQLLAAYAQETALRLLLPQTVSSGPVTPLTARQLEILRWARDGKSVEMIADIMSLSISTVKGHLRAAEAKLCVSGKHQAVVRAMYLGLL